MLSRRGHLEQDERTSLSRASEAARAQDASARTMAPGGALAELATEILAGNVKYKVGRDRMNTLLSRGLIALVGTTLYALPPTNGPRWWSTNPNLDCTTFHSLIHEIQLSSGGKGYACGVTGTFVWSAAGGNWGTSIHVTAPASGAIGVDYIFSDGDGNQVSLDTISGSVRTSGSTISVVLDANQPSEVQLLGASSDGPEYKTTHTGSVFGIFLCPDPATCATIAPQLLYSFVPIKPWLLSVPLAWDNSFSPLQPVGRSTRWSAVGMNGSTETISFAVYNQSTAPAAYTVRVYDSNGSLAGEATTPMIPPAGTRGFLLADVLRIEIPTGILKVAIDAPASFTALFLQFNGDSATSLQSAPDLIMPSGS